LVDQKLMIGNGHFYSAQTLNGMNIPTDVGVLRFSFLHYTNEGEIEQLIGGLEKALA